MKFDLAADELRRQEFARLAYAVTPRPEALRAMTADALRDEIATMWERLGHNVINSLAALEIVTIKGERKFITMYANPSAPDATRSGAVRQLRDRVRDASAERGFYVSVRGFTAEAQQFAETAPIQLIDGTALLRSLQRSRKGMLMPQSYESMCRQCGDIVQHRIDSDEAKRCPGGHFVAPTIARAELIKPRPAGSKPGDAFKPAPRPHSRREIRANNYKYEARMMNKPRG
jgi:Restriction endonuclease